MNFEFENGALLTRGTGLLSPFLVLQRAGALRLATASAAVEGSAQLKVWLQSRQLGVITLIYASASAANCCTVANRPSASVSLMPPAKSYSQLLRFTRQPSK